MKNLIIKGAIYTNGTELLQPHYTGEFYAVDCTEWKTAEDIKANYNETFYREALENCPITHEGVNYYMCECGPHHVTDFTLLSDLSELTHIEENNEL